MRILVTGGAGFIGSAVARRAIADGHEVVNLDALTYSANLDNVAAVADCGRYHFVHADICDAEAVAAVFARYAPQAVMHLAAESHNDRAIDGPLAFVRTNVLGAAVLLEAARAHRDALPAADRDAFRFHHVSTDEVFGALGETGAFDEDTPYDPNSPYSASKAGADHLVRAWGRTYGLPVLLTNSSNNYGPRQFPEKLIPTVILGALEGRSIPVYGDGRQVRDWLHVDDHAEALLLVLQSGRVGQTYAVGGDAPRRNIEVVRALCDCLDRLAPANTAHAERIEFVADRPGHDFRYAIDASKLSRELGWAPRTTLADGLEATARWYVENRHWWQAIRDRGFDGGRQGVIPSAS